MISQEQAIEIAQVRALEKDWAFVVPFNVIIRDGWTGGVIRYEIETNAGHRGTKARFVIDAKTGGILSEGYIPR